jgi:hypothetical protein
LRHFAPLVCYFANFAGLSAGAVGATRFRSSSKLHRLLSSEPSSWQLRHQFVAAYFSNQDSRSRGILLDLLPQSIDVRLELCAVTPEL